MKKTMKLGTRIVLGFGSLLVIMGILIAISYANMTNIKHNLDEVVSTNVYKMGLCDTMQKSVLIVSEVIRMLVLLPDKESIDREKERLDQARNDYDKAWEALQKTQASEEGKTLRAKIDELKIIARPFNNQVSNLAYESKDAEAIGLILKSAGPATQKWLDALRRKQ